LGKAFADRLRFLIKFCCPDVAAQDNYLACSFTVKSGVPLFVNGQNIEQIDIDSHVLNPLQKLTTFLGICETGNSQSLLKKS
jgi:putative methionine-R-sulfoxide reductase with GAF domain